MSWGSASEFFAMGGYGLYVWGAYGLTAMLMGLEAWLAVRRRRRAFSDVIETTATSPASSASSARDREARS
jgi:heme exporter protein D